jgi:hypothetical protein
LDSALSKSKKLVSAKLKSAKVEVSGPLRFARINSSTT